MLTMPEINSIKFMRNKHDKSINHIAKEFNIDWRTAKKYTDNDNLPVLKNKPKSGMMYTEKWGELVSSWLDEDYKLPKKKRRNSNQLFIELKRHGFLGSYRTVCNYVQSVRESRGKALGSNGRHFDRLAHPMGEAQVDFGTMEVEYHGGFKRVKLLIMSFPYSNNDFATVLPAENQECLLHGLKVLFRQAGGVPKKKKKIDNMVTAVKRVKRRFDPAEKYLATFEWHENILLPNEDTKYRLESLDFIHQHENAVFVGVPGTGKTHLAIALARSACEAGIGTNFYRVADLVRDLLYFWKEHQLEQFMRRFRQIDLIVLDEMGYVPFDKTGAELLFQLISDWYETKSIIITSNLEFSAWNKVFSDPRLTAALVDRLVHHAHVINFGGESYCLKHALSNNS